MEQSMTINESDLDLSLRDLAYYSNWMQRAVSALEEGGDLPTAPDVQSQLVQRWVGVIERLQERHRQRVESHAALVEKLTAQEMQLDRALSNLYTNMATIYESLGCGERAGEVKRKFGTLQATA